MAILSLRILRDKQSRCVNGLRARSIGWGTRHAIGALVINIPPPHCHLSGPGESRADRDLRCLRRSAERDVDRFDRRMWSPWDGRHRGIWPMSSGMSTSRMLVFA